MMVSASPLFVYPCEKQTVICQCLFITREGHVILSGLGWQLLGRSRQYRQGRALSHTDRIAEPDTEAAIHVCVDTHMHLSLPSFLKVQQRRWHPRNSCNQRNPG